MKRDLSTGAFVLLGALFGALILGVTGVIGAGVLHYAGGAEPDSFWDFLYLIPIGAGSGALAVGAVWMIGRIARFFGFEAEPRKVDEGDPQ